MITRILAGLGVVIALGFGYWLGETPPPEVPSAEEQAKPAEVWTCSMDPQVALPGPGACPICGMDLILRASGSETGDPARFTLGEEAKKIARVRTAPVERRAVSHSLRLVGEIGYDRTRLADITAWFPGRIDRMFVDYEGMRIRKGDHLYRIYSPALITAHAELLQAQRASKRLGAGASALLRESVARTLDAVRAKLKRWGLSSYQIKQLSKQKKASDRITLYAPTGGVVVERAKVEGTYVETGTRLYRIADLDWVWVEAWAYEHHLPWLRFGQRVSFTVDAMPGKVFEGRVSFIDPYLDPKIRANRVRISVANPDGQLKPGMFARVEIQAQLAGPGRLMDPELAGQYVCPMHPHVMSDEAGRCTVCDMRMVLAESLGYAAPDPNAELPLVIPATAPLLTGTRAVVYVEDLSAVEPTYTARSVVLGPRAGDQYVVLSGLMLGEQVVVEGAFKLDAELQIRAGPSMMNPLAARREPTSGPTSGPTSQPADPHAGHDHAAPAAPKAQPKKAVAKTPAKQAAAKKAAVKKTPGPTSQPTSGPTSQTTSGPSAPMKMDHAPKQAPKKTAPKKAAQAPTAPVDDRAKAALAAYLKTQQALAADDAAGAARGWRAFKGAVQAADLNHPDLAKHAARLKGSAKGGGDIVQLRKAFHGASDALIALLRAQPAAGGQGVTVFHCPMAFDNSGADWLQASGPTNNPYFGAQMLRCGSRRARIEP